ncbi:sulfatase [Paenibacillus sp. PAMC21692]|uniref:sulfatase family protein n=1 Tax=Paenibacillus sp. PAMC21692 TaxID=2762320 RepID=UPI00164D8B3E|nr:sulfatase [Paenibacillus sp. PAMC21692]QNK58201.1 sulfatase [Paenibacillus sp. PAMC21692]
MTQSISKPNVIWVFGDQHRAQALSCNGDPNVHTPNIDALAGTGVNFTRAVSGYPLCCPTRGSLLTSIYPHACVPAHQAQLPPEQPTIANVFNDAGYKTAYFGKWHLDGFDERDGRASHHIVPPSRRGGFQHWIGYENNNSQYDCWVHGGEGDSAFQYRLPGFETDEMTNLFIDYIRERGKEEEAGNGTPFFAVLSVQPPHNPYYAPEGTMRNHSYANVKLRPNVPSIPRIEHSARSTLPGYYAMIENLDWNVGRVRQALFDAGLAFNTHIVFFSDHGDMHGSHGCEGKVVPYEESIRVPFIISGEQPHYEGRRNGNVTAPVNHVDIAPTTLGLCGIEKPDWMQGTDYSHYRLGWRTPSAEPDSAFLQCLDARESAAEPWRGVTTRDGWKYVCAEGHAIMLYNLNEDPYEQVNLVFQAQYRNKRRELNERLAAWIRETGDSFALPD